MPKLKKSEGIFLYLLKRCLQLRQVVVRVGVEEALTLPGILILRFMASNNILTTRFTQKVSIKEKLLIIEYFLSYKVKKLVK